jgi:hypothetical protein
VAGGGGAADGGEAYAVVHGVDYVDGWWLVISIVWFSREVFFHFFVVNVVTYTIQVSLYFT